MSRHRRAITVTYATARQNNGVVMRNGHCRWYYARTNRRATAGGTGINVTGAIVGHSAQRNARLALYWRPATQQHSSSITIAGNVRNRRHHKQQRGRVIWSSEQIGGIVARRGQVNAERRLPASSFVTNK